ncbi:MAG: DUF309 domain-containing protein [Pirellulales bacterium]|nr:DUF309 domain-containing protein [Pirellulales bacterium]
MNESLPPYAYVPGRFPHPVRDPAGHSYGQVAKRVAPLDPNCWEQCDEFCRGLRLFDAGYYWEAHEAWEALWLAAGRRGSSATALKGLIKLAAAGVKAREANADGVRRHARRAAELLQAALAERQYEELPHRWAGLDLAKLARACAEIAAHSASHCDAEPVAVKAILPVRLRTAHFL